jgi:hypothetical protein
VGGPACFDISNLQDPKLVASVEPPCGSHTATGVPDPASGRLIVYNQTFGGPSHFFDIVSVPLATPAAAKLLRQEPLEGEGEHACHDSGVILGSVNLMACASGSMANVFDTGRGDHARVHARLRAKETNTANEATSAPTVTRRARPNRRPASRPPCRRR